MHSSAATTPTASGLDVDAYLARIGHTGDRTPTLATLAALQQRHVAAIPFETLSSLLGLPVPLEIPALQRKLLHEARGGYCYELNLLFLQLLQALGFDARAVTGRVVMGQAPEAETPRTHLLPLVRLDGADWTADVGFGGMTPTAPLRLQPDAVQQTPHEPFRLRRLGADWLVEAQVRDTWRPMYRFDLQRVLPVDMKVGNWYVATHPDSLFARALVAARALPGVRRTLHNGEYAEHDLAGGTRRTTLRTPEAVIATLRDAFGIEAPMPDRLDATLRILLDA